jgi:hypothetical protein
MKFSICIFQEVRGNGEDLGLAFLIRPIDSQFAEPEMQILFLLRECRATEMIDGRTTETRRNDCRNY